MNLLPGIKVLTDVGAVGTSDAYGVYKPVRVFIAHLISGTTASLYNGSSASGTKYLQIDGTSGLGTIINLAGGMRFKDGCFASFTTGTGISMVISYTEEF